MHIIKSEGEKRKITYTGKTVGYYTRHDNLFYSGFTCIKIECTDLNVDAFRIFK